MADTDPLVALALEALDLAVIEWLPDRTFRPFAPPPPWFKGIVQWSSLPFLEHVLPEAETFWREHPEGVMAFGPFAVERGGEELLLRVRALRLSGRLMMAIDRLTGAIDPRPLLQKGREQRLEHEDLEQRARAIHAPTAAIAKTVQQLRQTTLSPVQLPLIDALTDSVVRLQEAAGALPMPYSQRRQQ